MSDDLKASEIQVLGAVMTTAGANIDELDLTGAEFWEPHHEALWRTLVGMRDRGIVIDLPTVISETAGTPGLTASWIASTYTALVSTASATYHADRVRAAYAIRRVTQIATRMAQTAQQTHDAAQAVEDARAELDAISAATDTSRGLRATVDEVDRVLADIGKPGRFYDTPWRDLNDKIIGLTPGRVYVVGARPGSGKSILGLNLAVHFQRRHGLSTAFSSLEMDYDEVTLRCLAQMSGVNFGRLQAGDLSEFERRQVDEAVAKLRELPRLYVDDRTAIRPVDVRSHARNVSRRGNLGLIVVDYLGLMESGQRSIESRQVEVAGFSRAMKRMAREMQVPVVVLSQLNRQSDARNSEPRLSDLRDSGAVEQDADVVMLLHRESPDAAEVVVALAKNRQGPRTAFRLDFDGARMRMTDPAWGRQEAS